MQRQDNAGLLRIIGRLRSCLGADQIVADRDRLQALSRDFLRRSRGIHVDTAPAELPIVAVSPRCTDDVVATVRAAASEDIPIVEFGGGTGLMGGARTVRPGIVIDMRTLNRVLAISPRDRTVSVEAGAVLADVGDALAPHGLVIGHDPWTYPIATVGGTISTNGLGYLGAHYGSMGDQVLGLTVVTADGDVVRTRPMPRSSTGPRLMHLFIGAEGTLGIITEAVLRVFPRPEATLLMAYNFVDFEAGFRASEDLFAAGITPAMLDFGQTYAGIRLTDRPVTPAGARGLMNLAFQGLAEEARAVSRRAAKLLEAAGGAAASAQSRTRILDTTAMWLLKRFVPDNSGLARTPRTGCPRACSLTSCTSPSRRPRSFRSSEKASPCCWLKASQSASGDFGISRNCFP